MIKCTYCKQKDAVYNRKYSGESLCKKCFCESIEKKVKVTVAKNKMFNINDKIAVAISGGKDSLSLLHILMKIEKNFPQVKVTAIMVDEGIKEYRDEAKRLAIENCAELGVELKIASFKELYGFSLDEVVKKTKGEELMPCSYCGVMRRNALNVMANINGANKIVTGHNLDDEIQTFFLNIVHGDPFRISHTKPNLTSIPSRAITRVKPFCQILERETVLYAYLKKISFQDMPCPYAGFALRNDLRNFLNRLEKKHPSIKYTINGSKKKIQEIIQQSRLKKKVKKCKKCGGPTSQRVCQTCFLLEKLSSKVHINIKGSESPKFDT